MVNWLMEQLIEWLTNMTLGFLDFAVELLTHLTFFVPDVTVLPATRAVWGQNMTIVNTVYILAVVAAGVLAMTYDSLQVRYGVKELVPRLFLGAVAANFSFALLRVVLRTGDAFITAVVGAPLGDEDIRGVIELHVASALVNPTNAVLALLLALTAVVLLIVLTFQWYVRLGILLVLAFVAPLALGCYCLPGVDQVAALWWRTLFATLGTQVLQAVLLVSGLRVFLDPDSQLVMVLPAGAGSQMVTAGSPINLMVMIVILWATFKVSPMMRRLVLRSGGGSAGRIAVVLLVQQVTRGMSRGLGTTARGAARLRS